MLALIVSLLVFVVFILIVLCICFGWLLTNLDDRVEELELQLKHYHNHLFGDEDIDSLLKETV